MRYGIRYDLILFLLSGIYFILLEREKVRI